MTGDPLSAGDRPRVIYVAGVGRSGSTLLDVALGNHPRIESLGELRNLARFVWPENGYCACGERVRGCAFWPRVEEVWRAATGEPLATLGRLQEPLLWLRRWPSWKRSAARPEPWFSELQAATVELYRAIHQVSAKPVLVDSSKAPGLAFLLAATPGIDLRLVHLVRDGRGVAWSFGKRFAKDEQAGVQRPLAGRSIWRAAAVWRLVNRIVEWVAESHPERPSLFLKYEDLVAGPEAAMERVGRLIDLDLDDVGRRLAAGEPMAVGHNIAGNRIRMAGSVALRPVDDAWRRRLAPWQRLAFRALAGGALRRYGYL